MSYRHFTRISAGLLALLMLSMTACGNTVPETQTETGAADTVPAETVETRPSHGLPETDFGGAPFRISCYGDDTEVPYLQPEESIGEAVNDAIFNRNSQLMDAYNFVFETVAYGTDYQQHTKDSVHRRHNDQDDQHVHTSASVGTATLPASSATKAAASIW